MQIDYYYKFEKDLTKKSRYDLVKSTKNYEPFNYPNTKGIISVYLSSADYVNTSLQRKPTYALTTNKHYITGIFIPNINKSNLGFGDYKNDCLLFIINDNIIEVLIFADKKDFRNILYDLLYDGEFDLELQLLRNYLKFPENSFSLTNSI